MRNLRNIRHAAIDFGEDACKLSATAWDSTGLVCGFGPDGDTATITLKRFSSSASAADDGLVIASWDAPSPHPDLSRDRILDLHSFADTGTICVILEGGDIVLVREEAQQGQDRIEIVGSVDAGIVAASWSPDEELLLIVTKVQTALLMTREFEATATVTLSSDDLSVSKHVSVGWGKTETQFKGRGAKALRDPTVPERIDEGKLSEMDDEITTISWRGDGQYVAVNSVLEPGPRRRVIRVFSREGQLDSVSEPIDGLEGALSWKPSGQIIAGVQRRQGRIDVVFFERNGLRHGEFSLRIDNADMASHASKITLRWNVDSSVLAVCMKDRVQLWTMGNYHYYLKQVIHLPGCASDQVQICWHQESSLTAACFTTRYLHLVQYISAVSRGPVRPPHDQGLVAVVDGKQLKVTPLRIGNAPPPMALDEIVLPSNAIDVSFSQDGTKLLVLHSDSVSTWQCDYGTKLLRPAKLIHAEPLKTEQFPSHPEYRQITFDEHRLPVLLSSLTNDSDSVMTWLSTPEEPPLLVPHNISNLIHCINDGAICYLNESGEVRQVNSDRTEVACGRLPASSITAEIWREGDNSILFGLSSNGVLHIRNNDQTLKISGCTSFIVTLSHLIYTTSQHLLKFIHLRSGDLEVPKDEPETDERCRNVERGARLVTVIPGTFSLILQMPRGNLETIYPRALVLAGIRQAICERNYKKAFQICRTQRVDMNILHDHAPEQFVNDVGLFVKQVKRVDYIDLFLSSLSEENVSKTIYKETLKASADEQILNGTDHVPLTPSSKVNEICSAFIKVLAADPSSYLQCVITAHVCKNPPDLEAGLSLVSQLRKNDDSEQLEQAVEHICFLADVNQLYECALGIYDIDVALLVAQQSQKDPREYLPYLQNLHELEPLRQKFSIDNDLKRYSKALTHLHAVGDFEALKSYASKHELFSNAIELYRYDQTRLEDLMRLYADNLALRNRFKEAGIAYEYVQDFSSAYESYRAANMWRECLSCASMHGMPNEKLSDLARDLAASLEEAKDFSSASAIHLDHLHDLESACRLLCKAHRFPDATRHIALANRPDLLPTVLDPNLIESSASMTELLAEMKSQLAAQVPRLRELREKKLRDPMAFLDGGVDVDIDAPDDISLAPTDASTSGGTFLTRYTNRSTGTLGTNVTRKTSKNRRREERKRAKGKKGTVYEEEYLVNSVARLIERLNETAEDVGRLVQGLMRRGMRERAVAVDDAFRAVREACEECMGEVFATATQTQTNGAGVGEETLPRPFGGQGVLWDAVTTIQQKREAPVLRPYERLGLL